MKLYTDVGNCCTLKILVAAAESGIGELEVIHIKPGGKSRHMFTHLTTPIIAQPAAFGL